MLRLFTTLYDERRPERISEYLFCLEKNVACGSLAEICIIAQPNSLPLPSSDKIRLRKGDRRPNYDDFFAWINEIAEPSDVSLIANTDIWLDESISVVEHVLNDRDCFALSRWDGNKLFDRNDSQDCWCWRGQVVEVRGDFPVGVPRCDNRLVHELERAGYRVMNPSFSIRIHHVHAGARPEYEDANLEHFVEPPYGYVWPHNLWSLPRIIAYNLRHSDTSVAWRFDTRKLRSSLPVRAAFKAARWIANREGDA